MHFFKYTQLQELAVFFGRAMQERIHNISFPKTWVVVPVPLHRKKFNTRGFNQAALLAQHIAKANNLRFAPRALRRVQMAEIQSTLSKKDREKNLQGAFLANTSMVAEKNILLVDDVATTLSTLNECSKMLKKSGAKNIWAVVAARTP
jgi:ComF family protein